MRRYILPTLVAAAATVFTWIALSVAAHLYVDHQLVDAIRQDLLQRQAPTAQSAPPAQK